MFSSKALKELTNVVWFSWTSSKFPWFTWIAGGSYTKFEAPFVEALEWLFDDNERTVHT